MIKATLVTPLPPQPTGLADYAKRILALTKSRVEWTVAYPSSAAPLEGYNCVPISRLRKEDTNGAAVYQVGNSPHCEEVNEALLKYGGIGLFHETNMHHVLRNRAHNSGDWESYRSHALHDYGDRADEFIKVMEKKAKSLSEYDSRLRKYPLVGRLASSCSVIAVLSDTARQEMERLVPETKIVKMGFLPDFMERVRRPEKDDSTLVVGVAGSFHYGRSWEEMVSAVEMLRRTVDCRMLVAGGGWPETEFPWIEVTGRLSDKEFRTQIERFDLAIDLRHHTCGETSGSMMDILRSGIPAVVAAEGSFRDLPADTVLRIPSEAGAIAACTAMEYLVKNKALRMSMSTAAERYFAEVSDPEKCLAQWLELLSGGENEH